jgi:catechol 2,3-dioxygenase-like lactoylglutathione lyase family enzyme
MVATITLPGEDEGTMTRPELDGTLESALYATDLAAAERFYGTILGLDVIARQEGRHVFFAVGRSVLLIFNPDATDHPPAADARFPVPGHGARGAGHYCFSVAGPALDATRAHLEAHGMEIEADFCWPGGARSIYVRDPAGNSVEFAETALWFENAYD